MARPLKYIVDIGDRFGNWVVYGKEVNNEKYNYNFLCECDCGAKRIINKHTLLNNEKIICTECKNNITLEKKYDLVKQLWNTSLNRKQVPKICDLNISEEYWFNCPKGHIYKTTIQKLHAGDCPVCVEEVISQKKRDKYKENFDKLIDFFSLVSEEVHPKATLEILEDDFICRFKIPELNIAMLILPKIHKNFDRLIHKDKNKFLSLKQMIIKLEKELVADGSLEPVVIDCDLDFAKDSVRLLEILKRVN